MGAPKGAFSVKKDQLDNHMHSLEVYPFWKILSTQRLVVRFIPDLNESNNWGFIDGYHVHRVEVDGKLTMALCSQMHEDNQKCYHCAIARRAFDKESQGWNNDSRKHWRRQQFTANVIIIEDPLGVTDPENPKTYKLPLGKQLFNSLKEGLTDGNLEEMPTDYFKGNNFVIIRETAAGPYPHYAGAFQRKSKLTPKQIELADKSMIDLSELRPKLYSSNCQDELGKDLMWEILGNE